MKLNKTTLGAALVLCYGATLPVAHAAQLKSGDILTVTPASSAYNSAFGATVVTGGSWFGMDLNANDNISLSEAVPLKMGTQGLIIGVTQAPGGNCTNSICSYTGKPIAGDTGNINGPWYFSGNTGKNYTTVAPTGSTTNGIDMSGWQVTWNGLADIPMNTGAWQPVAKSTSGSLNTGAGQTFTNGVAKFTWDGTYGDSYSLTYTATVPNNAAGIASGFNGVQYMLHLEGTVETLTPLVGTGVTLANGAFGGTISNGYRVAAGSGGIPTDSSHQYPGGLYDFTLTGVSGSAQIVLPQLSPIPSNALGYYKYSAAKGWQPFTVDTNDKVESAPFVSGYTCPAAGSSSYTVGSLNGLTAGDQCVELTIADNGPNDASGTSGTIADPGGVAVATSAPVVTTTAASGHSGCSIDPNPAGPESVADWWLVAGFIGWLGIRGRKTRAK